MNDLSPLAALLGGVLTLAAPCSVMILPAFFAYAFTSTRTLLSRTALFWLGLVTTLVPLGLLAGSVGAFLKDHSLVLTRSAALVIIILGVLQALAVELPRPTSRARADSAWRDGAHPLSVYLLGATYGFAGVGCAGPILGAVLVSAGIGGNPLWSGAMMILYATGMAVPLAVLALVWRSARMSERSWMRPRPMRLLGRDTTWTNLVSGFVFVGLGLTLLLFDPSNPFGAVVGTERLAGWEQAIVDLTSIIPWWALMIAIPLLGAAIWIARPGGTDEDRVDSREGDVNR